MNMNLSACNKIQPSVALAVALCTAFGCASVSTAKFESPTAAMHAVVDAAERDDAALAERLFGTDGIELLRSGDPVADKEDADNVSTAVKEKLDFENRGSDTVIALIGKDAWPFPIPLVREGASWHFDVEAGLEEITNRRIGRNELSTISTMHEYVDAQREYASQGRDGNPPCFARRLISSAGKHDGLYWPAAESESESPMGRFVADAADEGYAVGGEATTPYHGYYYRSLERQGAHAPGGAKKYGDEKAHLSDGFALIAWPAKYGNSGVMTFVVGRTGLVYQRDLGPDTESSAKAIVAFDPDEDWTPTKD
jgi:Protein of unknown function (DUF2950)